MSKIAIEGNASGTGTLTIAAPNTNSNFTLDIPSASGVIDRLNRAGNVLQVVSATKTDTFSSSLAGGAFTDVTGLSLSITPLSASNKILVFSTLYGGNDDSNIYGSTGFRILRDAVGLHPSNVSNRKGTSGTILQGMGFNTGIGVVNFVYLDSPSSTSSLTYKVQVMNASSGTQTAYVNRSGGDPDNVNSARTYSTITVMEIAG